MTRRRRDLDGMIEAIVAGEPLPPGRLRPDEVEILRAAIALRAGQAGAGVADEEFVADLRRRLAGANAAPGGEGGSRLPRRALLGAAGAVAAGVVGAVAERALGSSPSHPLAAKGEIVPDGGQWVPVALTSEVSGGRVKRFATGTLVGFVTERNGSLSAISGACTHQGCLLQHNSTSDRLDCPCHHTAFGVNGNLLFSQLSTAPPALPQIRVREAGGQVEAFLPPDSL